MPIRRVTQGLFLLLILIFPGSIIWWHAVDNRPSSMDETRHMKLAMDYREWLFHGTPLTNEWSHVYPPVYHLSLLGPLGIGTPSEAKAAAVNIGYFFLFIGACLLLGRSLERPDWESLSTAFLSVGYGYVYWASRRALIDFPLTAWVTLSMAMLARTKGFAIRRESLRWGITAGVGILLKVPYVFFMVGPVLWALLSSKHPNRFKNFMAGVAVFAAISIPWFYWQSVYFFSKGTSLAAEYQGPGTDPRTLAGWLCYIKMFSFQMRVPSLVFTAIGLVLVAWKRPGRGLGLLFAWFLSGYLILSALVNKDPRHTLALLPALAFLSVRGWSTLAQKWGKPVFVAFIPPLLLIGNMSFYDRPAKEDWKHHEIIQHLVERHDSSQPFLLASLLSHHPRLFSRTLKWSAMREKVDLRMVSPGDSNTSFTEFIITRPGDQGSENAFIDKQWLRLKPESRAFKVLFAVSGRFSLPDGSEAIVYQRNPDPRFRIPGLSNALVGREIARALRTWIQGDIQVNVTSNPSELPYGKLQKVQISCQSCFFKEIPIGRVEAVIEKPWLNLYRLWDEKRAGLLAFESITPTISIAAKDVEPLLNKVKGLQAGAVEMRGGKIRVRGKFQGVPVSATVHVELETGRYAHLSAVLDRISIWGIPVPGWIIGKAHRQTLWLYPVPDFPGRIVVNGVDIENGQLIVK